MDTMKPLVRYDMAMLEKALSRDKATLKGWCFPKTTEIVTNNPEKLNRETTIHYKCECGTDGSRVFRALEDSGSYCKTCAKKKQKERSEATSIELHGVPNPMMNAAIRAKANKTILEVHGVANISLTHLVTVPEAKSA